MISRVRWVSVAAFAMLAVASVCLAADQGAVPGRGAIGGQFGATSFTPDRAFGEEYFGDYSEAAQMRFAFGAHWRYVMSQRFRWQVSPGFIWAGYDDQAPIPYPDPNFPDETKKGGFLTLVMPVSLQIQYTMHRGASIYYVGGGPGVYRVWVENHRKVLEDPLSHKLHRGFYVGGTAQIGYEHFMKSLPSTSLEVAGIGHVIVARRDEQFPLGFNSNVGAVELRVGANYYFTPGIKKKPAQTLPTTP